MGMRLAEAGAMVNGVTVNIGDASKAVSESSDEQSSGVLEATSVIQQMNASISQNADNSRQMEQMALKGVRDAEQSGEAVREMAIDDVCRIRGVDER